MHLVEHLAEIGESLCLWELLVHLFCPLVIDVAEGHNVAAERGSVLTVARPMPPAPMQATFNLSLADLANAYDDGGDPETGLASVPVLMKFRRLLRTTKKTPFFRWDLPSTPPTLNRFCTFASSELR